MAESDASIEAQLELKKRARRRLVGAAALALLAAILLPMVMDHEPRPPAQDIEIRIPNPDGGSPRLLPGKPAATPLPPVSPSEAPAAPEPKAEAKPEAKARPEAAPKAETRPEPQEAKAAPAPAEKPAEQAAKAPEKTPAKPAAESKPEQKTQAKAEPKAEPKAEARAEPKADAAAHAAGASADAEQWVVQLGAYKEAGNVKLLMGKLKEMNVPAYTEKFESPQGPRTRVRAGPFATKEAAEKARARAKIIGVDGPVAPK